jgi:uncharacterized protein
MLRFCGFRGRSRRICAPRDGKCRLTVVRERELSPVFGYLEKNVIHRSSKSLTPPGDGPGSSAQTSRQDLRERSRFNAPHSHMRQISQASTVPSMQTNDARFTTLFNNTIVTYQNNGDPGHDELHIKRVLWTCTRLAEQNSSADLKILLPAAILHDVVNVPKNHPDRVLASQQAAESAKGLLLAAGYALDEIQKITQVIVEHSFSLNLKPTSIESAILQDADKLDALGAIGIMRTVTCGALMKAKYYHPTAIFPENRPPDDKNFTIDHFFTKLMKLPERMNTEAGRKEADRRVRFMQEFLKELEQEL